MVLILSFINGTGQPNSENIYVDNKFALTEAAHEGGHLMGHADEYDYKTKLPFKGREGNIMSTGGAVEVDFINIRNILNAFGNKNTVKSYKRKH